jgi:hypothetical protein
MARQLLTLEENIECIPPEYRDKANKTPNQKKIKKRLEELGHKNVFVWWEPLGVAMEMAGCDGGYMFTSDHEVIYPIGYSLDDALDTLNYKTTKDEFLYDVNNGYYK